MHKNDLNAKQFKKEGVKALQKKIVMVLFVLVFSLTIAGAVSAADVTDGTTGMEPTVNNSTNNSQALPDPKLYDENMNLVGSYLTIQEAYSNAAVGTSTQMYTIELEENGIFTLTDFTIAKNLRFTVANGGTATIQGSNNRLIYIAPGYTVYFYNITFENGHASDGTTLHPDGYNGGAIYNEGTLYLTDCVFRDNQAGDGGAWDYGGIGGNGGAIYNTGTTTITDCEIYNNRAGDGSDGWAVLHSNGFNGGHGGAIYSTGTLTITGSEFYGNRAGDGGDGVILGDGGAGGNGGAIYNTAAMTITDSMIHNNLAGSAGDGGYQVIIGGTGGTGGNGGAIYNTGTTTITDSEINENTAGDGGSGADGSDGSIILLHPAGYTGHTGGDGGNGGAIYNLGFLEITQTTINSNKAGNGGKGGDGGDGVDRSILSSGGAGGAGGEGGAGGDGGAIYNTGSSTLILTDSDLSENEAGNGGIGGSGGQGGDAKRYNPFGGNGHTGGVGGDGGEGGDGGAIYNQGTTQTITNSNFTGNTAGNGGLGGDGGDGGAATTGRTGGAGGQGGNFGNGGNGGAILHVSGSSTVQSNNFIGNFAGEAATPDENGGYANAGSGAQATRGDDGSDGTGGAFFASADDTQLHFNRILDNGLPDVAGGNGVNIDATNNWWGTNFEGTNPFTEGRISELVDADPWVILRLLVPSPIYNGIPVQFVGDLTLNSDGNPVGGNIPDDVQADFTATRGTIDTPQYTLDGQASTTYSPTSSGMATFTVTVDDQTVTVNQNVEPRAVLDFTKSVSDNHPNYGDIIHFIITVQNSGPDTATDVNVTDLLPAGLVYQSHTANAGSYDHTTGLWNIGSLTTSMGGVYLDITVLVSATGFFNNTATLIQSTYPQDEVNRSATLNVDPAAILTVTKTDNTTDHQANVGDLITFTITTHNNGPNNATNIIITDQLPIGLDFVSASDGGTYDAITRTITWTAFNLDFGSPDVIRTFITRVNTDMAGNATGITNTANATYTEYPFTANGTDTTIHINEANITLTKTDNTTDHEANVGDEVTFTITIHNAGPDNATNVVITDVLPLGLDFVSASDGGTYDAITRTITWTAFNLNYGAPDVIRTFIAEVNAIMAGNATGIINTANATFTEYPSIASGTGTAIYVPLTDLYINSWSSKNNPYVGETITLTFKVGNNGPDTARNVVFTLPIPEGMEFVDVSVDQGTTTYDPVTRTITWILGDVEVGDPTAWVRVKVLSAGTFVFVPSLTTDTYDPNLESNIQSVTINAQAVPGEVVNGQTVGMQSTGIPVAQLLLAVLMVLGGLFAAKRQ